MICSTLNAFASAFKQARACDRVGNNEPPILPLLRHDRNSYWCYIWHTLRDMKREQVSLCVRIERIYVAGTVRKLLHTDGGIKICYGGDSLQEQYTLKLRSFFHG